MLSAYSALNHKANSKQLEDAAKIAACFELMQAHFIILDDIMDGSATRRGKPCWYTVPGVGLVAVIDALTIDCALNRVLRDVLFQHPSYVQICNLFNDTKQATVVGQMLDVAGTSVETCNWERYRQIVDHKTSFYSINAPLQAALLMADVRSLSKKTQDVAMNIGYLFQAQDDYLDCFGDPRVTGKVGTDLRDRKCTWVTCRAVEKLAEQGDGQLEAFKKNFTGDASDEKVTKLKEIIASSGISDDFQQFQNDYLKSLTEFIERFPHVDLRNTFRRLLIILENRKK